MRAPRPDGSNDIMADCSVNFAETRWTVPQVSNTRKVQAFAGTH